MRREGDRGSDLRDCASHTLATASREAVCSCGTSSEKPCEATASLNGPLGERGRRFHLPAPVSYWSRVIFMELHFPVLLACTAGG